MMAVFALWGQLYSTSVLPTIFIHDRWGTDVRSTPHGTLYSVSLACKKNATTKNVSRSEPKSQTIWYVLLFFLSPNSEMIPVFSNKDLTIADW
ncbi:hypothetical protein BJ166DRAFT_280824 [Pestalotiopsis sp. NC0098]|nr:hypothetical protein BJ166DRAFT_280824 [Pestalotiopsis sp. NC0098]